MQNPYDDCPRYVRMPDGENKPTGHLRFVVKSGRVRDFWLEQLFEDGKGRGFFWVRMRHVSEADLPPAT